VVEVDTMVLADGSCLVSIVDHGIGMTEQKFAEENQRLVERERLELAPTSVLGLFVVGRLARRHDLGVELLATPTTGGVTARLTIPSSLFSHRAGVRVKPMPVIPAQAVPEARPAEAVAVSTSDESRPVPLPSPAIPALLGSRSGFLWFNQLEPVWPDAEPDVAAEQEAQSRGGLKRRVRGAQLPSPGTTAPVSPEPRHDPEAAKTALDGFQDAFARAAEVSAPAGDGASLPVRVPGGSAMAAEAPVSEPRTVVTEPVPVPAVPQSRDGLVRRVPGAQLAPGLRQQAAAGRPIARPGVDRGKRDPAAERAAFDSFAAGLAKADEMTTDSPPRGVVAGRVTERGEESRK
jgi:hypothetical protein